MLILFGPPHISAELPPQAMLQSLSLEASVPPSTISVPQEHWILYSMPATELLSEIHSAIHASTVSIELSGSFMVRIFPYTLSMKHPLYAQPAGRSVGTPPATWGAGPGLLDGTGTPDETWITEEVGVKVVVKSETFGTSGCVGPSGTPCRF